MGRVVVEVSDELHLALKRRALEAGATVAELVRPALVALGSGPGGEGGDGTRSAAQQVHALTAHAVEPIPAPRRGVAPSGYRGPLDATGDADDREASGSEYTAALSSPNIAGGAAGAEPVSPPTFEPGESADREVAAGHSGPGITLPARSCPHPKDAERRLSWGTICGECGEKIR